MWEWGKQKEWFVVEREREKGGLFRCCVTIFLITASGSATRWCGGEILPTPYITCAQCGGISRCEANAIFDGNAYMRGVHCGLTLSNTPCVYCVKIKFCYFCWAKSHFFLQDCARFSEEHSACVFFVIFFCYFFFLLKWHDTTHAARCRSLQQSFNPPLQKKKEKKLHSYLLLVYIREGERERERGRGNEVMLFITHLPPHTHTLPPPLSLSLPH